MSSEYDQNQQSTLGQRREVSHGSVDEFNKSQASEAQKRAEASKVTSTAPTERYVRKRQQSSSWKKFAIPVVGAGALLLGVRACLSEKPDTSTEETPVAAAVVTPTAVPTVPAVGPTPNPTVDLGRGFGQYVVPTVEAVPINTPEPAKQPVPTALPAIAVPQFVPPTPEPREEQTFEPEPTQTPDVRVEYVYIRETAVPAQPQPRPVAAAPAPVEPRPVSTTAPFVPREPTPTPEPPEPPFTEAVGNVDGCFLSDDSDGASVTLGIYNDNFNESVIYRDDNPYDQSFKEISPDDTQINLYGFKKTVPGEDGNYLLYSTQFSPGIYDVILTNWGNNNRMSYTTGISLQLCAAPPQEEAPAPAPVQEPSRTAPTEIPPLPAQPGIRSRQALQRRGQPYSDSTDWLQECDNKNRLVSLEDMYQWDRWLANYAGQINPHDFGSNDVNRLQSAKKQYSQLTNDDKANIEAEAMKYNSHEGQNICG